MIAFNNDNDNDYRENKLMMFFVFDDDDDDDFVNGTLFWFSDNKVREREINEEFHHWDKIFFFVSMDNNKLMEHKQNIKNFYWVIFSTQLCW